MLSEVQKSNAADEMESEEKECVMVQLRETYASCVPCPAATSGGLCQHVLRYSFSPAQIQSPVVRSYMGSLE